MSKIKANSECNARKEAISKFNKKLIIEILQVARCPINYKELWRRFHAELAEMGQCCFGAFLVGEDEVVSYKAFSRFVKKHLEKAHPVVREFLEVDELLKMHDKFDKEAGEVEVTNHKAFWGFVKKCYKRKMQKIKKISRRHQKESEKIHRQIEKDLARRSRRAQKFEAV